MTRRYRRSAGDVDAAPIKAFRRIIIDLLALPKPSPFERGGRLTSGRRNRASARFGQACKGRPHAAATDDRGRSAMGSRGMLEVMLCCIVVEIPSRKAAVSEDASCPSRPRMASTIAMQTSQSLR